MSVESRKSIALSVGKLWRFKRDAFIEHFNRGAIFAETVPYVIVP